MTFAELKALGKPATINTYQFEVLTIKTPSGDVDQIGIELEFDHVEWFPISAVVCLRDALNVLFPKEAT